MTILNIGGVLLFVIGAIFSWYQTANIASLVIVPGIVTGYEGSKGRKLVISYHDKAGQEHIYKASWSSNPPAYRIGDRPNMYFKADDPGTAGIFSAFLYYWLTILCVPLGLAALLASGVHAYHQSIVTAALTAAGL